ncbi:MAG: OmpA family protein [Pseudomonadota bacterium]|nr:OmpA family protein [Pseudomonadota bacterium]
MNPDVAFRADIRHVVNFRGEGDTSNHNLLYTFGIALLFGGGEKAAAAEPEAVPAPQPAPAPPADSDGDGVPDSRDACPSTPRGVSVDKNGCPLDSDGDGVYDYLDKCPGTPAGAKVDEGGCPVPEKAELTQRGTYSFGNIYFDIGKSAIKPDSRPVLDEAVKYMKENPRVRFEIQGHTDNVGSEEFNQKLSDERAEAVRAYMIEKGIAAERLTAKGYSMSVPAAPNDTKEGRAKNRRIEFKPIR